MSEPKLLPSGKAFLEKGRSMWSRGGLLLTHIYRTHIWSPQVRAWLLRKWRSQLWSLTIHTALCILQGTCLSIWKIAKSKITIFKLSHIFIDNIFEKIMPWIYWIIKLNEGIMDMKNWISWNADCLIPMHMRGQF